MFLGELLGLFLVESVEFWDQHMKSEGAKLWTYSSSLQAYQLGHQSTHQASIEQGHAIRESALHSVKLEWSGHTVSGFLVLSYTLVASHTAAPLSSQP